ncbi:MAG: WG repeat-containing protein [Eubacteriales bacterium]|nr:WG repeat-containing protein [Eubacteriales bacterium]
MKIDVKVKMKRIVVLGIVFFMALSACSTGGNENNETRITTTTATGGATTFPPVQTTTSVPRPTTTSSLEPTTTSVQTPITTSTPAPATTTAPEPTTNNVNPQNAMLYPVMKSSDEWGYIDSNGDLVIDYIYDKSYFFSEGLASVSLNGKWGFVNLHGEFVIDPQYESCNNFHDGLAKVTWKEGEDYVGGYINKAGELLFKGFGYLFHDERALVQIENNFGYIDNKGKIVIEPVYDFAEGFSEGYARVYKDGWEEGWEGFIDTGGEVKIFLDYTSYSIYTRGFRGFRNGLASVRMKGNDGKFGFIDKDGNIVIEMIYDDTYGFSDGTAAVKYEGKWGYIDTKGEWVIEPQYDVCTPFREGFAFARPFGYKSGVSDDPYGGTLHGLGMIDTEGNFITEKIITYVVDGGGYTFLNEWQTLFKGELARMVLDDGRLVYLNKSGGIVWPRTSVAQEPTPTTPTTPTTPATPATPEAYITPFSDVRNNWNTNPNIPKEGNFRPEDIKTFWFNADTVFPGNEDLAEEIIENGKNPGLGIRALHERGITGRGVKVAIIDQNLAQPFHSEYGDRIMEYIDFGTNQGPESGSMHGPAVASLLVGQNCGTAPDAELYFAAAPSWKKDSAYYAEALRWIIETNRELPEGEKIRVVSVSAAPSGNGSPFSYNLEQWDEAVAEAQAEGILVLDCRNDNKTGIIKAGYYDPGSPDDITLFKAGFPGMQYQMRVDNGFIYAPTSFRTTAEHYDADSESYQYTGQGGLSWGIPYVAGVLALGWQVDPKLTNEEIISILFETAYTDKGCFTIINPPAFIAEIEARMSE